MIRKSLPRECGGLQTFWIGWIGSCDRTEGLLQIKARFGPEKDLGELMPTDSIGVAVE
jgi:hypothetical protein